MAYWRVYIVHLLMLLESSWGKVGSEDGVEVARHAGAIPERRVFAHESAAEDMVSINMFKVYERYSKEPQQSQRDGNTVRGFKAVQSE